MDVPGYVHAESERRTVHVVAGALFDAAGRVLVARRIGGTHLAGLWEFPGGKLMPGESRGDGLARELYEELGIRVLAARPIIWVRHRYPDRDIVLDVWRVDSYDGEPYGREGQPVRWRNPRDLDGTEFPPADAPVLAALQLPRRYLVTPEPGVDWSAFLERIAARAAQGYELIQLRAKSLEESRLVELGRRAADVCRRNGAKLLVNSDPEVAWRCEADGVHLTSRRLARTVRGRPDKDAGSFAVSEDDPAQRLDFVRAPQRDPRRPPHREATPPDGPIASRRVAGTWAVRPDKLRASPSTGPAVEAPRRSAETHEERATPRPGRARHTTSFLVGASCHDARDLERARAAACDFAVLGPVRTTPTHPNEPTLDWSGFGELARGAGLPVFAIGGLGEDDMATAHWHGGQGIAAIRAYWAKE